MKRILSIIIFMFSLVAFSQAPSADFIRFKPKLNPLINPTAGWMYMDDSFDLFVYDGSVFNRIGGSSYNFGSGLTELNGNVSLGGVLTGTNTLLFENSSSELIIGDDNTNDHILINDSFSSFNATGMEFSVQNSLLVSSSELILDVVSSLKIKPRNDSGTGQIGYVLKKVDNSSEVEWQPETNVTNLSFVASATDGTINSSNGNNATIPLADGVNAGLVYTEEIEPSITLGGGSFTTTSIIGRYYEVNGIIHFNFIIQGINGTGSVAPFEVLGFPAPKNTTHFSVALFDNSNITGGAANTYAVISSNGFQFGARDTQSVFNNASFTNGTISVSGSYLKQ